MNIQTPLSEIFETIDRDLGSYNFEIMVTGTNVPVNIYVNFDPDYKEGLYNVSTGSYHGEDDIGQGHSRPKISTDRDFFTHALVQAKAIAREYGELTSIVYKDELGKRLDLPRDVKSSDVKLPQRSPVGAE